MNIMPDDRKVLLSIIVPVYGEEGNISALARRIDSVLPGLDYELVFALDPSPDGTEAAIRSLMRTDKRVRLVKMSRRFGQAACTMAGLQYGGGDIFVVLDADLQDPPELIPQLIAKWREGFDVVYAQRRAYAAEQGIRRSVSSFGYWLINRMAEIDIPRDTGDFRLMSRRVVEQVLALRDNDAFLRGLVPYVGFNQTAVLYDRAPRACGTTKYNRMLGSVRVGLNGLLGFSKYPLHLITIAGFALCALSALCALAYVCAHLCFGVCWSGYHQLIIALALFSGVQLLCLGIIGEYAARAFDAVKKRPVFIVQETSGFPGPER